MSIDLKEDGDNDKEMKTYSRRYLVCLSFAVNDIANAIIWISFAPIQGASAKYYGRSQEAINMLSMIFMMLYVPSLLLCSYMFSKYGLRQSYIIAASLQAIGCLVRWLSTLHAFRSPNRAYACLLSGSLMGAIVQSFYINTPARISAEWFSKEERDLTTALLSMVDSIGIGIGNILPTFFVDDGKNKQDFNGLLLTELILASIGVVIAFLFHFDKPPKPPSISQKIKLESRQNIEINHMLSIKKDLQQLFANPHFFYLGCGFGIGLGFLNTLTTLINQYTSAMGQYSSNMAGYFGALLIVGGLFGAIMAGIFMKRTGKYKEILRFFTTTTCILMCLLQLELKPDNPVVVCILFSLYGFFSVPLIAVSFETAAECTFPINEDLSNGVLMALGGLIGLTYVLLWGGFLPDTNNGKHYGSSYKDRLLNFTGYFFLVNIILLLFFIYNFNGPYKRTQAEKTTEESLTGYLAIEQKHPVDEIDTSAIDNSMINDMKQDKPDKNKGTKDLDRTLDLEDIDSYIHINPNAISMPSNIEQKSSYESVNRILPTVTTKSVKEKKKKKKQIKNKLLDREDEDEYDN